MAQSAGIENLFENFRLVCQALAFQGVGEPQLRDGNIDERFYYQNLAAVLIFGPDIRLHFKMHFMLKEAKALAAQKFELPDKEVTVQLAVDMVKESCNRVAGRLIRGLNRVQLDVGHSLPFGLTGYNEIYFNQFAEYDHHDCFQLGQKSCSFLASVWVDSKTTAVEKALTELNCEQDSEEETGAFEML